MLLLAFFSGNSLLPPQIDHDKPKRDCCNAWERNPKPRKNVVLSEAVKRSLEAVVLPSSFNCTLGAKIKKGNLETECPR